MTRANVLLTTAGRKSYLARILAASPHAGHVVAVDTDPLSPIRLHADHFETVPCLDDGGAFVEALLSICDEHEIHCVLPQNDRELCLLASARDEFAKQGCKVAGVPAETARIVCDKYELAGWLRTRDYAYPRTWLRYPDEREVRRFVEKSRRGQGSQGLVYRDARDRENLASPELPDGKVVQERIDGEEYNLDILRDAAGCVVAVSVKRKLLMRDGSTDRAVSADSPTLTTLATRLAEDLQVFGSIDVDVMVSPSGPYVLDINPRMGGGFPFTAAFFPAYVDALLEVCTGAEVGALGETYQPDVLVCREYSYAAAPYPTSPAQSAAAEDRSTDERREER